MYDIKDVQMLYNALSKIICNLEMCLFQADIKRDGFSGQSLCMLMTGSIKDFKEKKYFFKVGILTKTLICSRHTQQFPHVETKFHNSIVFPQVMEVQTKNTKQKREESKAQGKNKEYTIFNKATV